MDSGASPRPSLAISSEVPASASDQEDSRQPSKRETYAAFLLAVGIWIVGLGVLIQHEFSLILFLRSLHLPVLEALGDLGNQLGQGITLFGLCGIVALAGWMAAQPRWRQVGIDGVVAHALAGVMTQFLKHAIGRPRPRFTHRDIWQFGPSLQSGLDAFPSGHASASFAVAAVLSRHVPQGSWLWYGLAGFVAISRVIRGSHFPTDVLAGALLGFVVGYVWSRPLCQWRRSCYEAMMKSLPWGVCGFMIFWVPFHQGPPDGVGLVMLGGGSLMILSGMGWRWSAYWMSKQPHQLWPQLSRFFRVVSPANLLIVGGLACLTQSLIVVGLTGATIAAWTVGAVAPPRFWEPKTGRQEVYLSGAVIGGAGLIAWMAGVVPVM
ncbi:MAG: phosphatase PAP2 family protein [Nitrospirae bacterium]|nr:MAG: phosphatase PAP2 family protein [Nitrospirota bacterium]